MDEDEAAVGSHLLASLQIADVTSVSNSLVDRELKSFNH